LQITVSLGVIFGFNIDISAESVALHPNESVPVTVKYPDCLTYVDLPDFPVLHRYDLNPREAEI
jgi:hypothetical protein